MYAPKAVPEHLAPIIYACTSGDIARLRALWTNAYLRACARLGRDDTCHPLLTAAHHLRVEAVEFLLASGLHPKQRGTVHPYTGDCMTVSELQGTSLALLSALLLLLALLLRAHFRSRRDMFYSYSYFCH
jgi:hypothetical protein